MDFKGPGTRTFCDAWLLISLNRSSDWKTLGCTPGALYSSSKAGIIQTLSTHLGFIKDSPPSWVFSGSLPHYGIVASGVHPWAFLLLQSLLLTLPRPPGFHPVSLPGERLQSFLLSTAFRSVSALSVPFLADSQFRPDSPRLPPPGGPRCLLLSPTRGSAD